MKKNDIVHLLISGDDIRVVFAALGCWVLGAVPAFGDSWLSEEALKDQVTHHLKHCFTSNNKWFLSFGLKVNASKLR